MKKTNLSIFEIYSLKQELEGLSVKTENAQVPIAPALISFFRDLKMKYWLQKLIDVLITESERFEKIKKDCLEETFGKEPKEEDLVLKYEDGSVNEKAVEFQAKINELAEEIVEVEHFAFNDNHLSNLKTTYHYIPNEDKTNQVIVTSEDTTGKYVNQEFIPQLFLRKLVEPCI